MGYTRAIPQATILTLTFRAEPPVRVTREFHLLELQKPIFSLAIGSPAVLYAAQRHPPHTPTRPVPRIPFLIVRRIEASQTSTNRRILCVAAPERAALASFASIVALCPAKSREARTEGDEGEEDKIESTFSS